MPASDKGSESAQAGVEGARRTRRPRSEEPPLAISCDVVAPAGSKQLAWGWKVTAGMASLLRSASTPMQSVYEETGRQVASND